MNLGISFDRKKLSLLPSKFLYLLQASTMSANKKIKLEGEVLVHDGESPQAGIASSQPSTNDRAVAVTPAAIVPSMAGGTGSVGGGSSNVPKLFEFKFVSVKSCLFGDNEVQGRFHIPLLVDSELGRLSIPPGSSNVNGWIEWKLGSSTVVEDLFHAQVVPKENKYHKYQEFRLGFTCQKLGDQRKIKKIDRDCVTPADIEFEFVCSDIDDIAQEAGGMLELTSQREPYAQGWNYDDDYLGEMKLYTVISELRPGQPPLVAAPVHSKPDWDRLEAIISRHPSTYHQRDSKKLLIEYKRFLAVKLYFEDKTSSFSPSRIVDAVWHIHLTSPEQYQLDVLAYGKQLQEKDPRIDPFIVPHCPLLGEETKERYEALSSASETTKLRSWLEPRLTFSAGVLTKSGKVIQGVVELNAGDYAMHVVERQFILVAAGKYSSRTYIIASSGGRKINYNYDIIIK